MEGAVEDVAAVRREILDLLRQQMEALDSPLGLSDARLTECYERQARVQELRDKLQASTTHVVGSSCESTADTASAPVTVVAPVNTAANF
jgi:hypothetical protein